MADHSHARTHARSPVDLAARERLLVLGDACPTRRRLGHLALDGPTRRHRTRSLHRLVDLAPRVLLPAHGPIPADPGAALATAVRRAQRLLDDPTGAVWYGARRILAFALMIRDGIPAGEIEPYLHARAWLMDAARLLGRTPEALATELIETMLRSGAVILREKRLHAAAETTGCHRSCWCVPPKWQEAASIEPDRRLPQHAHRGPPNGPNRGTATSCDQ